MIHSYMIALVVALSPAIAPKVMPKAIEASKQTSSRLRAASNPAWRPVSEVSWVHAYFAKNQKNVLVLYYSPYCPYSNKVLKYLKSIHKQVPMKNVADDAQAKAQFKNLGGKMQVPCLVIDGELMYESNDIINWLSQHQEELESANNTTACRMIQKMAQKPAVRRKISSSGSIPKLSQNLR